VEGPPPADEVTRVQGRLAEFARSYPELALYRRICEGAAADDEVAALLARAAPGQARPVLLLAALHDLVLRRPELAAARWYPSVTGGPVPAGDPWPEVRATALAHASELREVIATRSTQTNEVNRAAYLAPLLAEACADLPDAPVALVELGCSAGLLMGLDRYRVELAPPGEGPVVLGDPSSPVRCRAGVRAGGAGLVDLRLPRVVERVGLDRSPVAFADRDARRWLEACLWPDVPGRLERFRAAVELVTTDPPDLVAGDMVDDVGPVGRAARAIAAATAGTAPEEVHLVVMSSWALTYVARERRAEVAGALADLAADGRPVSWLTAEPPGCAPGLPPIPDDDADPVGTTVLGARRWRRGVEREGTVWGWAHPHAEWLHWQPPP